MANTLTNLYAEIYAALNMVAAEPIGFISSVYKNTSLESANTSQTIRYPIVPAQTTTSTTPSMTIPSGTTQTLTNGTMKVNYDQAVQIPYSGEEERGLANTGILNPIMVDTYAESFRVLRNAIENTLADQYIYASRAYGKCGTTPFSADVKSLNNCRKILRDNGCPDSKLKAVIDTSAGVNLGALTQNIASSYGDDANNTMFRTGRFLPMYGIQVFESGQVATVTSGNASTSLAAAEATNQTAIGVDDAGGFLAGDITMLGSDTNRYVAQTTSTGNITLNAPGLRTNSAINATVSSAATNYTANMVFHQDAIHLVTRTPSVPVGGDAAIDRMTVQDPITGLAFAITKYGGYRQNVTEVGIVWGAKVVKPDFLALLLG